MMVGFENIHEYLTDFDEFQLKWRFTDSKYKVLPAEHLQQLKVLNKEASKFLWDYINISDLHANMPFKEGFFQSIDSTEISNGNESQIKKWLYQRGLHSTKEVFLSWQPELAIIVPWKLLVKYFDDFYYGGSDDLTVIDESLNWALLFHHEDDVFFGSTGKFKPIYQEPSEFEK